MHTNYDQLARLRIEEHEADAQKSQLQRIAREAARQQKTAAGAPNDGGLLSHRRLIALPALVTIGAAALAILVR